MIDLRIEGPVNWESIEKLSMEVNRYHWDHWGFMKLPAKEGWPKVDLDIGFVALTKWAKRLSKGRKTPIHWLAFPGLLHVGEIDLLVFLQGTKGREPRFLWDTWGEPERGRYAEFDPYYPTLGLSTAWVSHQHVQLARGRTSDDFSRAKRARK